MWSELGFSFRQDAELVVLNRVIVAMLLRIKLCLVLQFDFSFQTFLQSTDTIWRPLLVHNLSLSQLNGTLNMFVEKKW